MSITPDLLIHAYRSGIFPMAERRDDPEIFWVDPRRRGILPLDGLHVSRSLAKRLKRDDYQVTLNTDFARVIDCCADRQETWINAEIRMLYQHLFDLQKAHSIEVWQDGKLVGGVYGVAIGRAFCGESMFSRITDGSKIALAWLVDHLVRTDFTLFDTQFITPHLASLGAQEITRAEYKSRLQEALIRDADFMGKDLRSSGTELVAAYKARSTRAHSTVQRSTQTS